MENVNANEVTGFKLNLDPTGWTPTRTETKKRGKKEQKAKEEITPEVISERAVAQIIGRAQAKAAELDKAAADEVMRRLEYQAKCNLEGNFRLIFTGASYLKIYPDGSREIEIPRAVRGKIFKMYGDLLRGKDLLDEEPENEPIKLEEE